ncbi:lipid-A-disaccharide synthase [Neolewinella antarctica]|uniref:Lipid-A-disaccharide synthase n=1 Tax=Neolewinella antarctica TaxID=442734 RepID=A0ABX0X607_9BACT|nr:lipid-A-disaccharide synthase [Neolewinella antarctica]NJC24646.1 lipid-A-disaccharide synthase [Neolewinella antarctica]
MKYYLIAGEPSGDLHGSNLVLAIKQLDPDAEFRAWGGDLLEAAGATLAKHYRELAFMGLVEVVKNLRTILGNEKFCRRDIAAFQPDRLILIDYSGFNLRIAKWAKPAGFDISYYISPQVWAWRSYRVKTIKATVDRMLVILPFEEAWYGERGVKATFVGHPLLDTVAEQGARSRVRGNETRGKDGLVVALLPGSRTQEITTGLPIMLAAAARHPQHRYVIAAAPGQELSFYQDFTNGVDVPPRLTIEKGATYDILGRADAALVTSGTATLETALFGVPQVVCYKGNAINYAIAKRLVGKHIKYISLVNLITEAPTVPELVQNDFTVEKLATQLQKITAGPERDRQLADLVALRAKLGSGGAAKRAARLIFTGKLV